MKPQSLAVYDRLLRERLGAVPDLALGAAVRAVAAAPPLTVDDVRAWTR